MKIFGWGRVTEREREHGKHTRWFTCSFEAILLFFFRRRERFRMRRRFVDQF